jgi:diamine N-acetyltransferase
MTFEIRRAAPHEAARLSALMRDLFLEAYRHCSTPANVASFLDATYSVPQQRAELDDPSIETVVVEDGADWLGFAQLRFGKPAPRGIEIFCNGAELGRIYLGKQAQGRGIGTALLRDLEARAVARGRDGLWLNAWQEAPQAVAFYRREGFEIVGTTEFIVGDDVKADWRMAKPLAPNRVPPHL